MGLDIVEFVIGIEHEFQLEIPDDAAATILTLGDVHRYVVSHFGLGANDPTAAWEHIVSMAVDQRGFERNELTPETRILELFPDG